MRLTTALAGQTAEVKMTKSSRVEKTKSFTEPSAISED